MVEQQPKPASSKKKHVEPGPERPEDESQAAVSYFSFQELRPLTEEELKNPDGFCESVLQQSKSEDWKEQYEAVNQLRVINKHNRAYLQTKMSNFAEFVKSQTDNLRSNLIKNSLLFVKELFTERSDKELSEFVRIVLPHVLLKTVYEKNFIVVEAKACME